MLTRSQDEVAAAQPEIDQRTEQLVSKGKWMVPGYKVFTRLKALNEGYLPEYRKNLGIFHFFRGNKGNFPLQRVTFRNCINRVLYTITLELPTAMRFIHSP